MHVLKFLNFLQVGKKSIRIAGSNFRVQKSEGVNFVLEVSGVKNDCKRCATYGLSLKIYELQFLGISRGLKIDFSKNPILYIFWNE